MVCSLGRVVVVTGMYIDGQGKGARSSGWGCARYGFVKGILCEVADTGGGKVGRWDGLLYSVTNCRYWYVGIGCKSI
jgi:hypothetical protein